jgi:hypothetical protein
MAPTLQIISARLRAMAAARDAIALTSLSARPSQEAKAAA